MHRFFGKGQTNKQANKQTSGWTTDFQHYGFMRLEVKFHHETELASVQFQEKSSNVILLRKFAKIIKLSDVILTLANKWCCNWTNLGTAFSVLRAV